MKIPVVWRSFADSSATGYWDQFLLAWLFDQPMPGGFDFTQRFDFPASEQGIVLVTPGHWRTAEQINEAIEGRPWVLLIVTSDEEGLAPIGGIVHPNISIWKHFGRIDQPWQPDRILPLGWAPGTLIANTERPVKTEVWFFAGQITHRRRVQVAEVLRTMSGGKLVETDHFLATDVMNHPEYLEHMRRAKVVPCPSGPNSPDTFRLYEALESGAVPIADALSPRGDWGYWHRLFGDVPFPVVEDWTTLPSLVEKFRTQRERVKVLAWWEQAKRDLLWRLHDDISNLRGEKPMAPNVERITVLVSSSPIPSHPSTDIIEQTIQSVRERLPLAEIIVMQDGVRPEQESYREGYTEYLERLIWLCKKWRAVPLIFDDWQHQANMTRHALELVRDELVLFVEHDTPLVGEIPFEALSHFLLNEDFLSIRFHHEQKIPKEHEYLMGKQTVLGYGGRGFRITPTRQWSQRPHLARTKFYRQWMEHFPVTSRTYIEDHLYGIVEADSEPFKLGIFTPRGSIQRSTHLDGRAGDSKFGF